MMIAPPPKYPQTLVQLGPPGISSRNVAFLLPVLAPFFSLPTTHRVLELASGEGVHVAAYAKAFPQLEFQPTEADAFGVQVIDTTVEESGVRNVAKAQVLDVLEEDDWKALDVESKGGFDMAVGANFLHMVPFPEGPRAIFQRLSSEVVRKNGGVFAAYGPFRSTEGFFSPGDEKFDAMIRARPGGERLGLRNVEELAAIAEEFGWKLKEKISMPVGNWVLVFRTVQD